MSPCTRADLAWMSEASCRGCDAGEFFPSDGVGVERARSVCEQCSVRVRCLEAGKLMQPAQEIDDAVKGRLRSHG